MKLTKKQLLGEIELYQRSNNILSLEVAAFRDELAKYKKRAEDYDKLMYEKQTEINALNADCNDLRKTVGHLAEAINTLNGVRP